MTADFAVMTNARAVRVPLTIVIIKFVYGFNAKSMIQPRGEDFIKIQYLLCSFTPIIPIHKST